MDSSKFDNACRRHCFGFKGFTLLVFFLHFFMIFEVPSSLLTSQSWFHPFTWINEGVLVLLFSETKTLYHVAWSVLYLTRQHSGCGMHSFWMIWTLGKKTKVRFSAYTDKVSHLYKLKKYGILFVMILRKKKYSWHRLI